MPEPNQLDAAFAALANPTRRAILAKLAKGEATVNELARPFQMTLPAISKHIRVLEDAGFITKGHNAQFRPCALNAQPLQAIANWADQYRPIWDTRFGTMDKLLTNMKGSENE